MTFSQAVMVMGLLAILTLGGVALGLMLAEQRTVRVMVPTPGPGCDDKAPKLSKPIDRVRV